MPTSIRFFSSAFVLISLALSIVALAQDQAPVVGVGITINRQDNTTRIGKVIPGGAAEAAGIKANDELLAVDNRDAANLAVAEVINLVRGPEGSEVTLTVRTDGGAPRTITMRRAAVGAQAAPGPAPVVDPLAPVAPAPAEGGAPAWVKPGVRLTYYGASALIVTDPASGKNRRDEGPERSSGQAHVQVNVAYVDHDTVALDIRIYNIDVGSGQIQPPKSSGWVGAANQADEYWIHPAELARMQEAKTPEGSVTKENYQLDRKTYEAIRIVVQGTNSAKHRIYDLESGVLLYCGNESTGAVIPGRVPDSTKGYVKLVSIRQLELPWNGAPAPDWVGQTRSLFYAGAKTVAVPMSVTSSFPVTAECRFNRTGPGWVQFSEHAELKNNMGQPTQRAEAERVSGTSQIGGLWIPPAALAGLQPGQLDHDPLTRTQFSYVGAKGEAAIFTERSSDAETHYAYSRRTGMLVDTATSMRVGGVLVQVRSSFQRYE